MTLEQDSRSEENCNLRSAKAGHSSNICLSSSNAPGSHNLQTRLARGRLAALLNWEVMTPHAKPQNSVQLGISHWCPIRWASCILGAPKPAVICAKFDPSQRGSLGS